MDKHNSGSIVPALPRTLVLKHVVQVARVVFTAKDLVRVSALLLPERVHQVDTTCPVGDGLAGATWRVVLAVAPVGGAVGEWQQLSSWLAQLKAWHAVPTLKHVNTCWKCITRSVERLLRLQHRKCLSRLCMSVLQGSGTRCGAPVGGDLVGGHCAGLACLGCHGRLVLGVVHVWRGHQLLDVVLVLQHGVVIVQLMQVTGGLTAACQRYGSAC